MTREEQILKVGEEIASNPFELEGFIEGAEWADENPQNPQLSAADRGIIDEIIFALNSLGKEKMISYHKEIEFLNKIRKL
jgi:hypothetical protein